jgi:hypothetical protein
LTGTTRTLKGTTRTLKGTTRTLGDSTVAIPMRIGLATRIVTYSYWLQLERLHWWGIDALYPLYQDSWSYVVRDGVGPNGLLKIWPSVKAIVHDNRIVHPIRNSHLDLSVILIRNYRAELVVSEMLQYTNRQHIERVVIWVLNWVASSLIYHLCLVGAF